MTFICDYCGLERKRTQQHVGAGDFDSNDKKKICIVCHTMLNTAVNKAFTAMHKGLPIQAEAIIGRDVLHLEAGSFVVGRDQRQIQTFLSVENFLEVHGRAQNFNSTAYPMGVTYGSGTTALINGGSVGGMVYYVVVYHPHESAFS